MLDIIICEDNNFQREQYESIINKEINKLNLSIVLSTGNPKDVIEFIENKKNNVLIYFLDVDLNSDISGIELASIIRKYDPRGFIIFITSHAELTYLTFQYKVQALDYILKLDSANIDKKIISCINEAYNLYKNANIKDSNTLIIESGNNLVTVNLDNVLFFETADKEHKIRIHTNNEQIEFYGTLKSIQDKVSSNFYKTHRAFLVNTKKIISINKDHRIVTMINGEICFVSALYLKGLIKKCLI